MSEARLPGGTYAERLGISVEDVFAAKPRIGLFHLMVVTLLEHGSPLTLAAIANRLRQVKGLSWQRDLEFYLRKAWHGLAPVVKTQDDRLALDLESHQLRSLLWRTGLKRHAPADTEAYDITKAGPLTVDEVRHALSTGSTSALSQVRVAAGLIDATGRALTIGEIHLLLGEMGHRYRFAQETLFPLLKRPGAVLQADAEGRLSLCASPDALAAMRRAIRTLARPVINRLAWEQRADVHHKRFLEEFEREKAAAAALRRAVIHGYVIDGIGLAGVTVLDIQARRLRTYAPPEYGDLRRDLEGFGLLVGLNPAGFVAALDLDPEEWRMVDLLRHQRQKQINRHGRTLRLTTGMLLGASTGLGSRAIDSKVLLRYVREGASPGKIQRRLESETKALFAFYSYGVLHRGVRLKWGFLDEVLNVDWALDGDTSLLGFLYEAMRTKRPVQLVMGSAPGWEDPWSRAQGTTIRDIRGGWVETDDGILMARVWFGDIQAARYLSATAPEASEEKATPAPTTRARQGHVTARPELVKQCAAWLTYEMGYELLDGGVWVSRELELEMGGSGKPPYKAAVNADVFAHVASLGEFQREVGVIVNAARRDAGGAAAMSEW